MYAPVKRTVPRSSYTGIIILTSKRRLKISGVLAGRNSEANVIGQDLHVKVHQAVAATLDSPPHPHHPLASLILFTSFFNSINVLERSY